MEGYIFRRVYSYIVDKNSWVHRNNVTCLPVNDVNISEVKLKPVCYLKFNALINVHLCLVHSKNAWVVSCEHRLR